MKTCDELNDLMVELIDNTDCDKQNFSERGKQIIDEVSAFAEATDLFKAGKARGDETLDGEPAWKIYIYMLDRIVNAPTTIHRNSSVLLIMPYLRKALKREEGESE